MCNHSATLRYEKQKAEIDAIRNGDAPTEYTTRPTTPHSRKEKINGIWVEVGLTPDGRRVSELDTSEFMSYFSDIWREI